MPKKTKTHTLLIWETFEESAKLFLIPDAPVWLNRCHRQLLNAAADEDIEALLLRVSDALCENADNWSNPEDPLAGLWAKHQLETHVVAKIDVPVEIVCAGFAL